MELFEQFQNCRFMIIKIKMTECFRQIVLEEIEEYLSEKRLEVYRLLSTSWMQDKADIQLRLVRLRN